MDDIVYSFLSFQVLLKIYHWQTLSYARHKASDDLFSSISEKIDKFVETLQGNREARVNFKGQNLQLTNINDDRGVDLLREFERYLSQRLPTLLGRNELDLLNLRDEMVNDIHQALYLYSLQ